MIGMHPLCRQSAGAAAPASAQPRFALRIFAGQRLCKGPGQRRLADVFGPQKQISVTRSVLLPGQPQHLFRPSVTINLNAIIVRHHIM